MQHPAGKHPNPWFSCILLSDASRVPENAIFEVDNKTSAVL